MKRTMLWSLAVLVAFALMPAVAEAGRAKISGVSHEHPEGKNYSYLCAKVGGRSGKRYKLKVTGPSFPNGETDGFRMGKSGTKKVTFEITSPGEYQLKYFKGRDMVDDATYNVPPPPPEGKKQGPFACTS